MILSAMMFALGVFVTGLLALAFCVALVRRTRRVTERRLMAVVTTRRADFEAERDELRARHAVQMHRLEREVARVLDMATAHRLEADVKDRDLLNAKAELNGVQQELDELNDRLSEQRAAMQEIERKYAESSTSLRAARHALTLESRRRSVIEQPLDQALAVADEKQIELGTLRAEVQALRADIEHVRRAEQSAAQAQSAAHGQSFGQPNAAAQPPRLVADQMDARPPSVIPLPVRARAGQISDAGSGWRATEIPAAETADPAAAGAANNPGAASRAGDGQSAEAISEASSHIDSATQTAAPIPQDPAEGEVKEEKAETLFVEALAEIRALKRAAGSQAAE